MKKTTKITAIILAMLLVLCSCGGEKEFSYSSAVDENGYWKGLNTAESVKLCDYSNIEFTQEEFDSELAFWKSYYPSYEPSYDYDGVVEEGSRVHVSFVGKIDGVPFDGGSSEDSLIEVGTTRFMDDNLIESLKGHKIGDKLSADGTFPENYGVEELNGKDSVFDFEILYFEVPSDNYDDEWVSTNFASAYDWNNLEEMREGILNELALNKVLNDSEVSGLPAEMIEFQKGNLKNRFKAYAEAYNLEIEEFLYNYVGIEDIDAFAEESARAFAIYQAIAENEGITVTEDDMTEFFLETYGTEDYSQYVEEFSLQYIKNMVMSAMAEKCIYSNVKIK